MRKIRYLGQGTSRSYSVDQSLIKQKDKGANLIGKPISKEETDPIPGPGTYNIPLHSITDKGIKQLFPQSKRYTFDDLAKSQHNERNQDLEKKILEKMERNYNKKIIYKQKTEISQEKKKTLKQLKKQKEVDLPGPGSYNMPNFIGEGLKVRISDNKDGESKQDKTPGPTNYDVVDIEKRFSTKKYSIRHKLNIREDKPKVGPGDYEVKISPKKCAGISFTQDIKMKMMDSFDLPGVGQYQIDPSIGYLPSYLARPKQTKPKLKKTKSSSGSESRSESDIKKK